MIIINNKYNITNPPLFASGNYFRKKNFQFPITTTSQLITHCTALKNNVGITLLYFKNGQGEIIVNSKSYPLQSGMFICLSSYHYFQINPLTQSIELTQCQISYDTFLYMAANPYYKFSKIIFNDKPLISLLRDDILIRIERLFEQLTEATNRNLRKEQIVIQNNIRSQDNLTDNSIPQIETTEFLLSMKLIGLFHKSLENYCWGN